MTSPITRHDRIAVLTLDHPPVNSFDLDTRRALKAGLDWAAADARIDAIVLTGVNGLFSGGADITEFGTPKALQSPNLHELIADIENSPKPVIAAINGMCMGGGTEMALACHYRVAAPEAKIGLPEVKLGLLPGAGGTQRLPRVGGVAFALKVIVSGEPLAAQAWHDAGALDALLPKAGFIDAVVRFTNDKLAASTSHPRVRGQRLARDNDLEREGHTAHARQALKRLRHFPAPHLCIDAIEAAVRLPIEEGLEREFALFDQLLRTPESAALRHAFFAERAAAKIRDVPPGTPPRAIDRVAVIGAGTMGGGIAINFLNANLPVTLIETTEPALARGVAAIKKVIDGALAKGTMSAEITAARFALLTPTLDLAAAADADLVIEAVFEDFAVKRAVFEQLDRCAKPGAILASNTSTLDLNRLAQCTKRPQDVIGLHFFSPANVMKLLEVVRGEKTAADVLATAMALAKKIGKTAVVSGVCDGFIGNRMLEQYLRQAWFLLEEGASVEAIDAAMENFGMAMGPFRMSDLAGNDIGWAVRKRRMAENPQRTYARIADTLCEAGRFGQKTGAGWYDYLPGERTARPSPAVAALVEAHRRDIGLAPRAIDENEIADRMIYALVNSAAQILDEGIAERSSDIDIVYLTGYGFPRWRGGPLFHADQVGLAKVVARMREFAANPHADPAFWQPAPLLARLAADNKTFNAP
jgi:3-hydroxyacyl-CoA dehydrogenase